jgi:hypothetical protein
MARHARRFLVLVSLGFCAAAGTPRAESGSTWLARLNFYRTSASLPAVVEDPALSRGVMKHARYMVVHEVLQHSENRRDTWATPEGAAAAAVSNLAGSTLPSEPDNWAVDLWMQAPFHAIGILDPSLKRVGFGIEHAQTGKIQTAAGLDVIRGRSAPVSSVSYPIVWPANGASVPIAVHLAEYPSPLTSCPGYEAPTGLPLIVQLGSSGKALHVTRSFITEADRVLEHCIFDGRTYRNPDRAQQQIGQRILAARDAIVLIPRQPLRAGSRYRAVVEVDGRPIDWTFMVNAGAL